MKYKIDQFVSKITAPIEVLFEDKRLEFADGYELADCEFEKPYIIQAISSKNNKVVIVITENNRINDVRQICKEQAGFF